MCGDICSLNSALLLFILIFLIFKYYILAEVADKRYLA